jgi:hypothetical protein
MTAAARVHGQPDWRASGVHNRIWSRLGARFVGDEFELKRRTQTGAAALSEIGELTPLSSPKLQTSLISTARAVLVIGPESMPQCAVKLARLLGAPRGMADTATAQLRKQMGRSSMTSTWKQYDLRQYGPRLMVREVSWRTT